ncbi:MAG: integrase, partial [Patescibacteria group bacterium]
MLGQYPFKVFNFHSDRGSEFINKIVAKLLNKLLIEQTKSRSRHTNDNALVESKNGSVIRKNMGYTHVNFEAAESISKFYQNWFNPYLNYHRPCLYVTEIRTDQKGRQTKIY